MTAALIRAKPAVARMTVPCIKRGRGKPPAEKAGGLRERAWWLMRQKKQFTRDDLLTTLADGSYKDAPSNLQKYITALERVGVLVRLKRRTPGTTLTSNGHVIWRVAHDLGRAAPVWRVKQQELLDPNSGMILFPLPKEAQAEQDGAQP
jgi:hypothetical protein